MEGDAMEPRRAGKPRPYQKGDRSDPVAVLLGAPPEDGGRRLELLRPFRAHPRRVGLEALDVLGLDLLVDERLDVGEAVALLRRDEGDGNAVRADAAGAADAVDVVLGVLGQIVVD